VLGSVHLLAFSGVMAVGLPFCSFIVGLSGAISYCPQQLCLQVGFKFEI
jgi:hypothetical protein